MNSNGNPMIVSEDTYPSTSEGGPNLQQPEMNQRGNTSAEQLLCNMETLLNRILTTQVSAVSTKQTPFLNFDPDDADSDINDWCKVSEVIVQHTSLEGVNLLVALTSALKGRAAACLTKINLNDITWKTVKETLIALFSKPKFVQDYFEDILRFKIGTKETASESAFRLWNLIERIPESHMSEETMTAFVVSVLCWKNDLIHRELNTQNVANRAQLLRILGGISLKRRRNSDAHKRVAKRPRIIHKCNYCGKLGHHSDVCRSRSRGDVVMKSETSNSSSIVEKKTVIDCYTCSQHGHVATSGPDIKNLHSSGEAEVKVPLVGPPSVAGHFEDIIL